jgi:hypothetical protein
MLPSTSTRRLFPVGRQTKEDMREEEAERECVIVVMSSLTHTPACCLHPSMAIIAR